jgi:DNA (cytosine-5)-methyltransferase 1
MLTGSFAEMESGGQLDPAFPLANGVPARVGRLRTYGNAINIEAAAAFISPYGGAVSYV